MRKVIWCCSAAGVLTAGGFLSLAYYACRCPDSFVGRSMQAIARASVAMQPLNGLNALAMRTSQLTSSTEELPGVVEECVPAEPQPIAPERKETDDLTPHMIEDVAPIVIHEDDPMPRAAMVQCDPPVMDVTPIVQGQEMPPNGCPVVMPLCRDDDELPAGPPRMPLADEQEHQPAQAEAKKTAGSSEETELSVFKEWMKLFEEGKEDKSRSVEELPPPTEELPQTEPKCQEDTHLHEHYSGLPRVSSQFRGEPNSKQSKKGAWDIDPKLKKKGKEESSEEPPQSGKRKHSKGEEPVRTQGVDTMEYRPTDGGLNEYGPGPIQ